LSIKAQGTQLYFIDPADDSVVEVDCITELTGLSMTLDQIDTTCLADLARSFEAGLATPGTASFTIRPDPREPSHIRLHQLFTARNNLEWAVGWSDGTVAPVGDSGGVFDTAPLARTFLYFNGYINDFPFNFAQNTMVEAPLGIQTSGDTLWVPKA